MDYIVWTWRISDAGATLVLRDSDGLQQSIQLPLTGVADEEALKQVIKTEMSRISEMRARFPVLEGLQGKVISI